MKVLAKLGLVTAAAATVLFIFIYEFQGPVFNRVMSQPPSEKFDATIPAREIEEPASSRIVESEPLVEEAKTSSIIEEGQLNTESTDVASPETTLVKSVNEEPEITSAPVTVEEKSPAIPTRHIYGKITLSTSGELLEGVNIMVPGTSVAKVSNASGGYTIEVPRTSRELVFIYRGKKLVQKINSDNNLVNVRLDLEKMNYD